MYLLKKMNAGLSRSVLTAFSPSENKIAYLYDAASSIGGKGGTFDILQSYYLMRCKGIGNKGQELPTRLFGPCKMCAHCSSEWRPDNSHTKIIPQQKMRKHIRRRRHQKDKEDTKKINEKLHSNTLVTYCKFCKKSTITKMQKTPSVRRQFVVTSKKNDKYQAKPPEQPKIKKEKMVFDQKRKRSDQKHGKSLQISDADIYSDSKSVFSMKNVNIGINEKVAKIKSTRKKDKFAGLCKEAVIATAKAKQNSGNVNNPLNAFLKPSL